ncbi:MAG: Leucine Rich Repeat [Verrucomicrobiales bacterium]|nr:Leucine Rich Repeat [Verrucomicrobiales bacterium]
MADSDDFIAWATNPKLNIEEAFCAEVIVEKAVEIWRHKNKMADPEGWEPKRERHKKRCLNPAHRIKLNPKDVERAASVLNDVHHLWLHASKYSHDDRPIRDLCGFRFLRGLKDVTLHGAETTDISVLAELPELQKIGLWDEELNDLNPLSRCLKLESISLHLSQPWPQFASLQELPALRSFEWRGNPFVLETLGPLPHVIKAKFEGGFHWKVPLRDLRRLPEMPAVRVFELDPAWSIDGIERWQTLTNLTLNGNIRDLKPLHRLPQLTHLTLKTERLANVQELVGVPELRYLLVESEHPVDFSSLTDAPRLHQIEMKRCEINKMEVGTLNSILPSWDEEFATPTPRAVGPLRFRIVPNKEVFQQKNPEAASAADLERNPGMFASEAHWIAHRLQSRLNQLLGGGKWGKVDASEHGHRAGCIEINSLEAAESLPKILDVARQALAQTRFHWEFVLRIGLKSEWHQKHPELEKELQKQQLIDEHLDWEARQKERKEFLERKHRADLMQQDGMKLKPEDFAAPDAASGKAEEAEAFSDTLAFPDEPEPHPLAEQLDCLARFTESELVVGQDNSIAIQHFMGRKADG